MRNRLRILAATGVVAAGLVGVLGATTAASASTATAIADVGQANSVIKRNTTSFNAPSLKATRVHTLHQGERVHALCYREGQKVDGTFTWFKIEHRGNVAYVHLDAISAPGDLPYCF